MPVFEPYAKRNEAEPRKIIAIRATLWYLCRSFFHFFFKSSAAKLLYLSLLGFHFLSFLFTLVKIQFTFQITCESRNNEVKEFIENSPTQIIIIIIFISECSNICFSLLLWLSILQNCIMYSSMHVRSREFNITIFAIKMRVAARQGKICELYTSYRHIVSTQKERKRVREILSYQTRFSECFFYPLCVCVCVRLHSHVNSHVHMAAKMNWKLCVK